jgi:PKD repeat protein
MKLLNHTINMRRGVKTLFVGLLSLILTTTAFSQACQQVEIIHQSPECLLPEPANRGLASGQDCTPIAVCINQPYTYKASGSWNTYLWAATGPVAVTGLPASTPTVTITWPVAGVFTLNLTVTDASGNTFTNCLLVTVKDKPVANFTFSPNGVCAGSTVTFNNTSTAPGAAIYNWNFGDAASGASNFATTTNTGTTVNHVYNTPGIYQVTLIASNFTVVIVSGPRGEKDSVIKTCCSDTIRKKVSIAAGNIKIECTSTVCAGQKATYNAVGCAGVVWLPPVGGTILSASSTSVTIQWGNGAVQGQILAQCPGGCIASVPVPIIPQNPQPQGNLFPCTDASTSYSLPLLPGTFYTWQLIKTSNGVDYSSALNTYPDNNTVWVNWGSLPPGAYDLNVNLENKNTCCTSKGKITITSKERFAAYYDQLACTGTTTASLYVSPAAGSFSWSVLPPNGGVSPVTGTGPTFAPGFANAGVYYAQVYETGNTYCNSGLTNAQTVKITAEKAPAPGTINGPATVCPGSGYNYNMSTPAPAGYFYAWTVTGGTFQPIGGVTATGNSAAVTWTSFPGSLSVVLKRSTVPVCVSATVTLTVNKATIGTIAGNQNVCVDDAVVYTLSGSNLPAGQPVQWSLTPGNLGTITSSGTTGATILWHGQVTGTGPWTATVTATSACGNVTLFPVTIYRKPVVNMTQSGNLCNTVTLTAAAGYTSYQWLNPLGAVISTSNTATATMGTGGVGNYTVTVKNGPSCSLSKSIFVEDPFEIIPNSCGLGYCNGTGTNEVLGVAVIKPAAGPFTYQWFSGVFPGGTALTLPFTSTVASNNYTALAPGPYYVTVTYGSCTKTVAYNVKKVCCPDVNNPQITSVVYNSCNQLVFTGTTPNPNGASITWNFGDGTSQAGAPGVPVVHNYATAGSYCVTFCVGPPASNPTNCTGNCAAKTVIVPLQASFRYSLPCNANGCISIDNNSVVIPISGSPLTVQYIWNFGDGTPAVTSTSNIPPAHCYTTGGTYTLTLTINYTDPGVPLTCTSTASATVVYTPLSIVVPTPVCTGQQAAMSSSPGGFVTYAWNFGDGYSAYTPTTTHAYNTAGTFTATLTVTELAGATCSTTKQIVVNPGISSCTIQPGYICAGGSTTLTAAAGLGTYLWQVQIAGGGYASAPGVNTNNTYNTSVFGFYRVIITNASGCTCTSNTVPVTRAPQPRAVINASNTQLCGDEYVILSTPVLPNHTYAWYANAVSGTPISTSNVFGVFTTTTTTYFLVLTNEYGCKDVCQLTITVSALPAPPVISSTGLCEGVPITLTVTNYSGNITWNNGASATSIVVSAAGIYTATYTDPVSGCFSSKDITINKRPLVDLFPHYCDSISCSCKKDTLYAPQPLLGYSGPNYNINWYYNGNLSGTGSFYTPAPTGTYYIVVTNPATGCAAQSEPYSIVSPNCNPNCYCDKSYWGKIVLSTPIIKELLQCGSTVKLDCNQPYSVLASYNCAGTGCPGKVTYSLQPPAGPAVTGDAPLSFTPTQSGIYGLTLYGWCGDKICDSCEIKFEVTCPDCDCKGSTWGDILLAADDIERKISCGETFEAKCNQPFTIDARFLCELDFCPSKVTYSIQPPAGPAVTGNAPFSYTPTQGGSYTITLYGWCGDKICDSCEIRFKSDCPACICEGSTWGDILLTTDDIERKIGCGEAFDAKCNQPFTIDARFLCALDFCPSKVTYSIQPPAGPAVTGNAPFSYTPTQGGSYTITLYGWCGDKICDSCEFKFNVEGCVDCNCDKSYWGTILLSTLYSETRVKCGQTAELKCNEQLQINAEFFCNGNDQCPPTVTYSLQPPTGPAITGNAPFSYTPTQSGIYTLTLYGWCGGPVCKECTIYFKVECPADCGCEGSYWSKKFIADIAKVPLNCGTAMSLNCNTLYTVVAAYACADPTCQSAVQYKLTGPLGTSTGTAPFTFTPTASGVYTLTLYGYCGTRLCDSCVVRFEVNCPPVTCCRDTIKVGGPIVQMGTLGNPAATVLNAVFPITGPALAQYTAIKAEVVNYQLSDNFDGACLKCFNLPYTWASMYRPGTVSLVSPQIPLFNTTVTQFNPAGGGQYQNPRQVVWIPVTTVALPGSINLSFLIPPPSAITCCELNVKICVKFTFRKADCSECESVVCFDSKQLFTNGLSEKIITVNSKRQ